MRAGAFDAVTFTSASTATNYAAFGDDLVAAANEKVVICIGPETEGAARSAGLKVDHVPDQHTTEGIVETLLATRR
jgi:uroporphyrinogen-III synthase